MNQRRIAYIGILALFLSMGTGCSTSDTASKPGVTASGSVAPDDDESSDDMDACKDTDESPSACGSASADDDTCECGGDCMDTPPSGSPAVCASDDADSTACASDAPDCMDGTPGNAPCGSDSGEPEDSADSPVPCPASSGSPAATVTPDLKALNAAVGDLGKASGAKDLGTMKTSLDAAMPLLEKASQDATGARAEQLKSALAHAKQAQTEKSLAQARTDVKQAVEAAKAADVPAPPTN